MEKKYIKINAHYTRGKGFKKNKYKDGCHYCGEVIHQICARCEVLLHEPETAINNQSHTQLGIISKSKPWLCTECEKK